MLYGICNLSIVPLRDDPSDKSELVSQVLFGDHFKILEKRSKWSKIRIAYDKYEGWIDNKQYLEIDKSRYESLSNSPIHVSGELINAVSDHKHELVPIPLGVRLPNYSNQIFDISGSDYTFEGKIYTGKLPKRELLNIAFMYLNAPYLWGGKTPFGIDCSGFTQMVYKICGHPILRDASQQATQGEALSFIEESEPGDLAFFDNKEGNIIHVGIIMPDNYIIHAHGHVRIDRLDHTGIYNVDTKRHSHNLRVIKQII